MSVMAGGSIEVSVSKPVPHEVFDTINKQYIKFSGDDAVQASMAGGFMQVKWITQASEFR